ncbi:MAG: hypothetical protein KAJ12_06700 [Bacteroidetes bacterium]|nr:hypothetical protein [Bacteroidota bacterium]
MSKRIHSLLIAILLLPALSSGQDTTSAQEPSGGDPPVKVILTDGSAFIGIIEFQDADSVRFRTLSNVLIVVGRNAVKSIEKLPGEIVDGSYRRVDPNRSRLLFAPTARPIRSGQGYFAVYEIFFPFIAVGIADVLSLAGGVSLVPGLDEQLFYLAPKISLPLGSEVADFALGAIYGNMTGGSEDGAGVVYGVGTFGGNYTALTVGLGYGFHGADFSDRPVVLLGGEAQVSNSVKFVSENWIPVGSDKALLSLGIRFFGDALSADLGLFYPLGAETNGFPFLPWLGFAYCFGG